jgi:hypothetical protein
MAKQIHVEGRGVAKPRDILHQTPGFWRHKDASRNTWVLLSFKIDVPAGVAPGLFCGDCHSCEIWGSNSGVVVFVPSSESAAPSRPSFSVGLLWTSDQPDAETSTWQHTTLTRDRHSCPRRDSNLQSQEESGRRTTPSTVAYRVQFCDWLAARRARSQIWGVHPSPKVI